MHLTVATGIDQCDILAVPAARADVGREQPAAVGAPLIPHIAITIGVDVLAIHEGAHGLALHVNGAQGGTILKKGNTLAVGAVSRLDAGVARIGQLFLHEFGGIGEQFLILVLDGGLVNFPHAVALAVIDDATAIGREVNGTFLLGCIGDPLGGLVVNRGHIHIAMHHKCHLLATRRDTDSGCSVILYLADEFLIDIVGRDGDIHTFGLGALAQGINLTVVAIAQHAIGRYREKAHGITLVVSELHRLAAQRVLIDVERAVLLAQVVIDRAVGCPAGRAVLTVEVGELGILPALLQPDVAGDGRGVMLAEGVLVALDVVIEDITTAVDAQVLHGQGREQAGPATADAHLINLGERAVGKQDGLGRGHIGSLEQHGSIVEEGQRCLVATVGGETTGRATILVDNIHVKAAFTGRRKCDALSVGAPHGISIIGRIGGQLTG